MMELAKKPTKIFGTRHWQVLLFFNAVVVIGVGSTMSVAVLAMTDTNSNNPNVPTFNWDGNQRSLLLSCILWGPIAAQIPFSFVVMRLDVKKLLTISMLITGITCLMIPVLTEKIGYISTLICVTIVGLTISAISPCLQNLISRWIPHTERSRFGTFIVSGTYISAVVSMFLGGQIAASSIGWPGIFYMYGLDATVCAILIYFFSASSPSQHPRISREERDYIESNLGNLSDIDNRKNLKFPYKEIIKSVPAWAFVICLCGEQGNYYIINTQLPNFMKNALNFDIDEAGGISALPYLIKWLLCFPISWLSDYALKRGVRVGVIRKVVNTIGMWGPAMMLLVFCLIKTNDRIVIIAIMTLCVGLNAGIASGIVLNGLDLAPNFSGILSSIASTAGNLCGMVGPIVANAIVTNTKDVNQWYVLFYITIAIYFTTNLVFIIFGKAEEQPWNDPNHSDKNEESFP